MTLSKTASSVVIEALIEHAIQLPKMYGSPKEFEFWVLALIAAWEAVLRGNSTNLCWQRRWRDECQALGLNSVQSLTDRPRGAPQDEQHDYTRITTSLRTLMQR